MAIVADLSSLFWLFFLLAALQPALSQRLLESMRRRKLAQIEKRRGSRAILLVHRQEMMRLLGFPVMRYIDINDSEQVLRAIQLTDPRLPLDLILHTPGGLVVAALQIARALQAHPPKVTVFVPHLAMSGGTPIALAADEIVMCTHSVLGPIDPQIQGLPAVSYLEVVARKPMAEIEDQTLVLADIGEKAVRQICHAATGLLADKMLHERAEEVARTLSHGVWTHDYPISAAEARALGLPVTTEMPSEVLELMALYPQPMCTVPSVEYLPSPRAPRSVERGKAR